MSVGGGGDGTLRGIKGKVTRESGIARATSAHRQQQREGGGGVRQGAGFAGGIIARDARSDVCDVPLLSKHLFTPTGARQSRFLAHFYGRDFRHSKLLASDHLQLYPPPRVMEPSPTSWDTPTHLDWDMCEGWDSVETGLRQCSAGDETEFRQVETS